MHINCCINSPHSMSKSLYGIELFPFTGLCFVYFHEHILSDSVCSSTEYNHHCSNEDSRVLVSSQWCLITLVWCVDPIPSSISVSSETPCILQGRLITSSSTKDNHHTCRTSHGTKRSRVIDSCWWHVPWSV